MKPKRKVALIVVLSLVICLLVGLLPGNAYWLDGYYMYVYVPLQSVRGYLLNYVAFSIGDAVYVFTGAYLLYLLSKWARYVYRWNLHRQGLLVSVLNTITGVLWVYLWFLIGWGVNYYQQPLHITWQLSANKDTLDLKAFDSMLVTRLNQLAPAYKDRTFDEVNTAASKAYSVYTDIQIAPAGLQIKYSYFGYFLDRIAIDGYYDPFTGEGQVSSSLPAFMLPFVVSHEMAHQAGIAAEGDANLLAYAIGTSSVDPVFNYSADLNLWLYVNARLSRRDSVAAQSWEDKLNPLTQRHIAILEERSKLYDNDASRYSGQMYDSYLKMQQQKEGIRSYGNFTANAWQLERLRQKGMAPTRFHIP